MGCRHTFTCTECSLTWKVSGSGEIDYGEFARRLTLSQLFWSRASRPKLSVPVGLTP